MKLALNVGELYASFGIDTKGVDKALANIEAKFSNFGRKLTVSGAAMSAAVTAPLVKIGRDIYNTGKDFGASMSKVFATAGLDESIEKDAEAMETLKQKALEMGSTTKFTSSEAAEALNYMAMAGWETQQMTAGIAPIMNLAAASGEQLGAVSDIVTDALTAFRMKAEEAGRFADVLAKAASKSNTNVAKMGNTFQYVAPVAGAMGYSVEDMAVAIGMMANAGIKGEMAGTQLRNIITGLVKPTKEQAQAMEKYGVSLTRQDGSMKSFAEVVENLRSAMKGLSKEEKAMAASIFGGVRGMSGLLAIANTTEEEFQKLTYEINNASGAADKMAKTALDNAAGDLTYLKSAVDGAKISLWNLVEGPFRKIIQDSTKYVTAFNQMGDATKKSTLKFAGFSAALGPAMIAVGRLVSALPKLRKAFSLSTLAITPLGLGLLAFGAALVDTDNSIGRTMESISKTIGSKAGEAADYISSHTQEISDRMGEFLKSLKKSITSALPNILQLGSDILVSLMDGISLNMGNIVGVIQTVITTIGQSIKDNAPYIVPSAIQLAENLLLGMVEAVPTLIGTVGEIAVAIGEQLITHDWADTASRIWEALKTSFNATKDKLGNLGDTIKEKFGVDSWEGVADKIWSGLWSAVNKATSWAANTARMMLTSLSNSGAWNNAGSFFANMANKIVTGISNAIPGLFENVEGVVKAGFGLGAKILEGLNTALSGMKDADLGSKLGGAAVKLLDGLLKGVGNIAESQQVKDFVTNLGKGIESAMSLLGDIAGKIISYIFSAEGVTAIFNAGANMLNILVEGLSSAVMGAGTFFAKIIDNILTGLGLQDPAAMEEFKRSGRLLTAQIQAGMTEGMEVGDKNFTRTLLMAMVANRSGIDTSFLKGTEMGESIEKLAADAYTIFNDYFENGADLKNKIGFAMPWNEITGWEYDFSGVSDEMWNALYDAIKSKDWKAMVDFLNIGAEDIDKSQVENGAKEFADAQAAAIEKYGSGVAEQAASEQGMKIGGAATEAMKNTATEAAPELSEAFGGAAQASVDAITLIMTEDQGNTIASAFLGGLQKALESAKSTLPQLADSVAASAVDAAAAILTYNAGDSIGWNFAQGMAAGIRAGIGAVQSAAAAIANAASGQTASTLQIHSPSRVMQRMGQFTSIGFAKGVLDEQTAVKHSVKDMAKAALDSLGSIANKASNYGAKINARLPQVSKETEEAAKKATETAKKQTSKQDTKKTTDKVEDKLDVKKQTTKKSTKKRNTNANISQNGEAASDASQSNVDMGALIENFARLVAASLNGVDVVMDKDKVGNLLAPVISETIANTASARRYGTT